MPLNFDFAKELNREATRAIDDQKGLTPNNVQALGMQEMLTVADRCLINSELRDVIAPTMKFNMYWTAMMALVVFEEAAERSEKVDEETRPLFIFEDQEALAGHCVEIKFYLDCGDLSLKCKTVTPGKEDQTHTVGLKINAETIEIK